MQLLIGHGQVPTIMPEASFFLNNPLIKKAREYANNMPSYPSDGYIETLDDMIIVKLSEYKTE